MSQDDLKNTPPEDERGLQTDPIHQGPRKEAGLDEASESETLASDEPRELAGSEADRIVKICKACMVSQRGGGNFCVKCGNELVPIRAMRSACIGDVVNEKYTIVEAIGSGGMGDVYLGINKPLGQRVAIKFLNQKFTCDEKIVLRFLNEARSYCKVNHPNAVTLLEYGQHHDGSLYLITEYIEGESLTEVVRTKGPLPTEAIISVGVQVCEVLTAAHKQGVIHRDLKPDNLMLVAGSRGRYAAKVLDFGIAKIADDDNNDGGMTETGSVFGTPEFMSPEQARGDSADPRSDLYALGVILYFMATAKLPFRGKNKFAVLNKQLHDAPVRPGKARKGLAVHPELEELILHCLMKSPEDRPQTADDIAEALESIDLSWVAPVTGEDLSEASEPKEGDTAKTVAHRPRDVAHGPQDKGARSEEQGFDDEPAGPLEMDFEASVNPLASTAGVLLGDEEDELANWVGELDTLDPDRERVFRVDSRLGRPLQLRTAALGMLATLMVVGGVIWYTSRDVEQEVSQDPAVQADTVVYEARSVAMLEAATKLVDEGEFAGADALLARLQGTLEKSKQEEAFEQLVRRASRARNTEMQLRAAVDSHRCDDARGHLEALSALSSGAAAGRLEMVEACGNRASTPEPETAPEPQPVVERPRRVEPEPAPQRVEPEPAPQPVEPEPAPAAEERAQVEPEPAPVEVPEPVEEPAPSGGEVVGDDGDEELEEELEGMPPRRI